MKLLVDIGNTRVKWCVDNNGVISTGSAVEHKQSDFLAEIRLAWAALDNPQRVAIASVSSNKTVEQVISLITKLWPNVKIIKAKSMMQGFSVINAYPKAETLGVDRWLGLIALQHYYPGDSCLIDCGTAVTIDSINSEGQHLGGLICPGIQLMKQSLCQGTEDLSYSTQQYPAGLADFTEAAIYSGTLFAVIGLIEKVTQRLCTYQNIVLTGGDAKLLAEKLEIETIIEPDFVLKGLSLYCKGESV